MPGASGIGGRRGAPAVRHAPLQYFAGRPRRPAAGTGLPHLAHPKAAGPGGGPGPSRPGVSVMRRSATPPQDKRDFDGDIAETNGPRMAKGTCPVCGTRMNRILGKA